jgi:phage baseplate assembly protein W
MAVQSEKWLGAGWAFPIGIDSDTRDISIAAYEESVLQSIHIILGTAKGERLMRPDFGCGIEDLVFSVHDTATKTRIADEVRDALLRWETRIDVLNVDVHSGEDGETLWIAIEYRIRATNTAFNLVYPFYVSR